MAESAPDMLASALRWAGAGCSVLRVSLDGSKTPLGTWKQHQATRAEASQVRTWFQGGYPGLGVVCGHVSGDLELLEFEGRAVTESIVPAFTEACAREGITEAWTVISAGCALMSPSGGLHLYYRVEGGVDGNTKLAQRHARDEELTDDERHRMDTKGKRATRVLIETRGEGGFAVTAPSHGPAHPTGRAWRFIAGGPQAIPTLTAAQRDALHIAARRLDQLPTPEPIPEPAVLEHDHTPGLAPGADYNQRGSWRELLEPHGWRPLQHGSTPARQYWTRPGKTRGVSAVTGGEAGDYLWCWSSSTELPTEQALSKWRVYALLEHGGDFHAAAKALKQQGYGQPTPSPTRPVFTVLTGSAEDTAVRSLQQDPRPTSPTTLAHSDDGNALALVDTYGDRIRHCPERSRWLHWTGQRWQWCPVGGGVIREYAKQIARGLPSDDAAAVRHKTRALSALGTAATLTQAATDPRIVVVLNQLDAYPLELNTPAGIVDLRTGTLTPHNPDRLHTRITACAPDPDADPGRWNAFLADTFAGHDELVSYLQRLAGYGATGVIRDHVLPFAFGSGANGKGVLLEVLRGVLGDYATTAPSGFLMARTYPAHETEIARLAGTRMVVCSEVNEQDRFDEAKVKQLTGGDTLTARFMREDHFTFSPTHKLWLMGNHRPTVTSGGYSFWRRLRIIPFDNVVPEERRIDQLQEILITQHGPAVLSWIIQGAVFYLSGGLSEPASVRVATADYVQDQDTINRFVEECCHLASTNHQSVRVLTSKFRQEYESWTIAEGEKPVSPKRLGQDLRSRFKIGLYRSDGRKFYTGIALLASETGTGPTESPRENW